MAIGAQTYAFGGAPALGSPVPGSKAEGDRDGPDQAHSRSACDHFSAFQ